MTSVVLDPCLPALGEFRDLTGIGAVDRALRTFERETLECADEVEGVPWELSSRWGSHPDSEQGAPNVFHLAEPEIAAGQCYVVSEQLVDWLDQHDIKARVSNENPAQIAAGGFGWCTPDGFGYLDRTVRGYDVHHWAEIFVGDDVYGVDFTSTQYGYNSVWPVVQKLDVAAGRWQRDW